MKKWKVTIPCTMALMVTVEAENEEEAKQAAFSVDFLVDVKPGEGAEDNEPELIEFETHEQISYGNVYCGCINDMEVEAA